MVCIGQMFAMRFLFLEVFFWAKLVFRNHDTEPENDGMEKLTENRSKPQ